MNDTYIPFDEFYYSTVCHVCKTLTKLLKTCNGCKAFRYCSVEHQKLHWPSHKLICKIFRTVMKENLTKTVFSSDGEDWFSTRIKIRLLMGRALGRFLTPSENQIWMFPRVCAVCNEFNGNVLFDCPLCPTVSYCTEDHKFSHEKVHSKICSQMELQYKYYCNRMMEMGQSDFYLMPDILNMSIDKVLNTIKNEMTKMADADMDILTRADRLTHSLSLLNAMETSGLMRDFKSAQEKMTFHIVGATFESLNISRAICELIFDWITNLMFMEFVFIGPELDLQPQNEWNFCNYCQEKNVCRI